MATAEAADVDLIFFRQTPFSFFIEGVCVYLFEAFVRDFAVFVDVPFYNCFCGLHGEVVLFLWQFRTSVSCFIGQIVSDYTTMARASGDINALTQFFTFRHFLQWMFFVV